MSAAGQLPGWHCVAQPAFWPGCGQCGPCRDLAPEVFEALGKIRKQLRDARGYTWDDDDVEAFVTDLLELVGER